MTSLRGYAAVELTTSSSLNSSPLSSSSYWQFDVDQYKLVVNVYVVATLCVVGILGNRVHGNRLSHNDGILGNVVSVVVLGRDRSIRRTTGLLLRSLGVSDTAYLVTCLLFQTVKTVHEVTDWLPTVAWRAWPYLEPYVWPLASIAQTCNVWLVVVLTADRYVAICKPLHAAQYR